MRKLILIILLLIPFLLQSATINVTNYGAKPTDGTDDTIGIEVAITASSSNDTIYFPAGFYRITNSISIDSYRIVEGEDKTTTIISNSEDCGIIFYLNTKVDVEIHKLTLSGGAKATRGIQSLKSSYLFLHDLIISDFATNSGCLGPFGIYFSTNVTQSIISNNIIKNIGTGAKWSAGMRLSAESSHNTIVNNTISNIGRGGILCNNGCTNLIIQTNNISYMRNNGIGIEIYRNCHRALIECNVLDYWISIDDSNECAIRRNTIKDVNNDTTNYGFMGLELACDSANMIFTYNEIGDHSKIGINMSGNGEKKYGFFGNNIIDGATTWGVQLQGDTGGVVNQYFYNNDFKNILTNHPAKAYSDSGHGFRFNGDCSNIVFENNEIYSNEGRGIQITGSNIDKFEFWTNTIIWNGAKSITTYSFSNLKWTNNTVNNNGDDYEPSSIGFANTKPTAAFSSVDTVTVGVPINFTDTSTDGGSISHRLWDFDDGLPSTSSTPSYTYSETGTYTVTLIVWDNEGRADRTEKVITVQSESAVQKEGKRFKVHFNPAIMKQMGRDLDKGLEGRWSMSSTNTNTDGRMNDISDNTNYLTLVSIPVFVTNHLDEENNALRFNGTNEYAYTRDMTAFPVFSFATWLKVDADAQQCYIAKYNNNGNLEDWMLYVSTDQEAGIHTWVDGSAGLTTINTVTIGTWAHVVFTFDSANVLSIYLNGDFEAKAQKTGDIDANSQPISWGSYALDYGAQAYKRGYFCDSRLYNRCLTAWEVRKLYYNTKE
jgi:PKD repeat protein